MIITRVRTCQHGLHFAERFGLFRRGICRLGGMAVRRNIRSLDRSGVIGHGLVVLVG